MLWRPCFSQCQSCSQILFSVWNSMKCFTTHLEKLARRFFVLSIWRENCFCIENILIEAINSWRWKNAQLRNPIVIANTTFALGKGKSMHSFIQQIDWQITQGVFLHCSKGCASINGLKTLFFFSQKRNRNASYSNILYAVPQRNWRICSNRVSKLFKHPVFYYWKWSNANVATRAIDAYSSTLIT